MGLCVAWGIFSKFKQLTSQPDIFFFFFLNVFARPHVQPWMSNQLSPSSVFSGSEQPCTFTWSFRSEGISGHLISWIFLLIFWVVFSIIISGKLCCWLSQIVLRSRIVFDNVPGHGILHVQLLIKSAPPAGQWSCPPRQIFSTMQWGIGIAVVPVSLFLLRFSRFS